ncbi:collinsiaVII-like protein [Tanacetum coccineum]
MHSILCSSSILRKDIVPLILKDDKEDDDKHKDIKETTQQIKSRRFKVHQVHACKTVGCIQLGYKRKNPNGLLHVTVMHSPPRPVTVEDQQEWKITLCISILKNVKGYIVPLDIQIAAHEGIDAKRQGKKRERTTLLALSENACFEGISGTEPTRDMIEQLKRGKIREKRHKEREY